MYNERNEHSETIGSKQSTCLTSLNDKSNYINSVNRLAHYGIPVILLALTSTKRIDSVKEFKKFNEFILLCEQCNYRNDTFVQNTSYAMLLI